MTLRNNDTKCEAQDKCADLGMCLIIIIISVVTVTELSPPPRWLATAEPTPPPRCLAVFSAVFVGAVS